MKEKQIMAKPKRHGFFTKLFLFLSIVISLGVTLFILNLDFADIIDSVEREKTTISDDSDFKNSTELSH